MSARMVALTALCPGDRVTWDVTGTFEHLRYRATGTVLAVGNCDDGYQKESGAIVAWDPNPDNAEMRVDFAPFWNNRFNRIGVK